MLLNLGVFHVTLKSQPSKVGVPAPLEVEMGRMFNIPRGCRLCKMCDDKQVETQNHFLFHWTAYAEARTEFYEKLPLTSDLCFRSREFA